MKVNELIKELKKFHKDAEVVLCSCYNESCSEEHCNNGQKNCQFVVFGIDDVVKIEKNSPGESNSEHDYPSINIILEDGWNNDENGELVKDDELGDEEENRNMLNTVPVLDDTLLN